MTTSYKIPESVLVVIYTPALDVLLLERAAEQRGYWQSVTGSKDFATESLRDTAIREVREETGIVIDDGTPTSLFDLQDWHLSNVYEIYPMWRHRYAPDVTRNTEHVFGLKVPANTIITIAPREHLDFRWLPYRAAADHCFSPSNAEAILQLSRYAQY